jgi:hypothetical protein
MTPAPFLRVLAEETARVAVAYPHLGDVLAQALGVALSGDVTLPPTADQWDEARCSCDTSPCPHVLVLRLLAVVVERVQAEEGR